MALALLVVLDKLNAAERIAFLPHDTFAVSFEEIGSIVDRSPVVGSKENRIPSRPLSGGYDPLALEFRVARGRQGIVGMPQFSFQHAHFAESLLQRIYHAKDDKRREDATSVNELVKLLHSASAKGIRVMFVIPLRTRFFPSFSMFRERTIASRVGFSVRCQERQRLL